MPRSSYIDPWQFKPWWCQPWSIALTGVMLILGSWIIWHRMWLTVTLAVPLGTWMGYFLIVWPQAMQSYLSDTSLTDSDGEKT